MPIYRCAACGAVNRSAAAELARCERCRATLDTSGAPQPVDAAALVSAIASCPAPVLVDFAGPGGPTVSALARARAGELLCLAVDTAAEPAAAAAYRVGRTPTLVLFASGRELARLAPGAESPADAVTRWLAAAAPR